MPEKNPPKHEGGVQRIGTRLGEFFSRARGGRLPHRPSARTTTIKLDFYAIFEKLPRITSYGKLRCKVKRDNFLWEGEVVKK